MTPAEALALLRDSRDADHDAPIWADDGATVTALARRAGVTVTYVHVDLRTLETARRIVEGKGARDDSTV